MPLCARIVAIGPQETSRIINYSLTSHLVGTADQREREGEPESTVPLGWAIRSFIRDSCE